MRRYRGSSSERTRLDELYRIGVDEISYRRGHRYLSVVAETGNPDALTAMIYLCLGGIDIPYPHKREERDTCSTWALESHRLDPR